MPDNVSWSRRIRILRDDVSRKIAAGEVIDRPLSIVRELLDNSIDAKASSIDVHLESGGISRVRVVDDGSGMDLDDLELCWQPHATSKIVTEDDLLTVTSLGFRGEALSSMAVAGRLQIVSAAASGSEGKAMIAHRIDVRGGKLLASESCQGRKGTVAEVSELFFDFPARRKFLKSPSAESGLCRAVFVDRAAAHPGIGFRLFADAALRLFLPPSAETDRISAAYGETVDRSLLGTGRADGQGFTVCVVAGDPSMRRRDRKLMQVFVNRRRVPEYSIMQAVEYGFAGYIPGGWFPVAFVFVDIDPSLADFNIHPAKKEVRLRNLPEVHAAVVRAVKERLVARPHHVEDPGPLAVSRETTAGLGPLAISRETTAGRGGSAGVREGAPAGKHSWAAELLRPALLPLDGVPGVSARFLGQVFGVFLVFEMEERLLLLDQHAAHERAIFERLSRRAPDTQELLIPLCFDVSDDEDDSLSGKITELSLMGIVIRRAGARAFEVLSLPSEYTAIPEGELIEMLRGSLIAGEGWKRDMLARVACRLALKQGDPVDPVTAAELLRAALALDTPRCPHGRPIWREVSRTELYGSVDRPL
jgi:DNA mismatch repair protein MutL